MAISCAVRRYRARPRHGRPTGSADRQRRDLLARSTQAALDRVTHLAAKTLDVAAVCASLVDAGRGLLASSYGLPVPTALLVSHAFRKYVMASRLPLVVTDGRHDPLVAHHPAVRDGTVRSCVGIPLNTADGCAVGMLIAMDQKPRRWTASQLDLLRKLATLIVSEMELGGAVRQTSDISS